MEYYYDIDSIYEANYVTWVYVAVAAILVAFRVWHRACVQRKLWWDDYLLVVAMVSLFANAVMITEWISQSDDAMSTPHYVLIGSLLGTFNSLVLVFSTASLAFMLTRLTPGWWKISMWFNFLVTAGIVYFQAWSFWFQNCSAPSPEPLRLSDGCVSTEFIETFRIFVQAALCAMDILMAVLLLKTKWLIEINLRSGCCLGLAMGFGLGAALTSIIRLGDLVNCASEHEVYIPSWAVDSFMRNLIEPAYTIMAVACFPVWQKRVINTARRNQDGGRNQDIISTRPMTESHEKTFPSPPESISKVVGTSHNGSTGSGEGSKMQNDASTEVGRLEAYGGEKGSPKSKSQWISLPIVAW
ncbi:hypothetical protein F5X99DRAFT_399213 [Biscogniauxia marginata]|nr:hypothetical protein F5X99DRAFT_399213 [Biscogniauxia marginata]